MEPEDLATILDILEDEDDEMKDAQNRR